MNSIINSIICFYLKYKVNGLPAFYLAILPVDQHMVSLGMTRKQLTSCRTHHTSLTALETVSTLFKEMVNGHFTLYTVSIQ